MRLVFLIPSKGRHAALTGTLPTVAATATRVGAAILVCDQSPTPYPATGPWQVIHRPGLTGLPAARNCLLATAADADLVCFCDDDVRLGAGFAQRLLRHATAEPDIDAWGPVVEVRDRGTRRLHRLSQFGALRDPRRRVARRVDAPTDALFGCCFAVRGPVARHHRFDPRLRGYALGEDLDFCRRLRHHGHQLRFCRDLTCLHLPDVANRDDPAARGRAKARLLLRLARRDGGRNPATVFHLALALVAAASGQGRASASPLAVLAGILDPAG
jgi:GT2 family glycosyltransferase